MVKLIGAGIILFSATMAGRRAGRSYALRPAQLRSLILSLSMLETEIVFGSGALHRAFNKIAGRVPEPIAQIYEKAAIHLLQTEAKTTLVCWQQAIEQAWSDTSLRKAEKDVLINLGYVL